MPVDVSDRGVLDEHDRPESSVDVFRTMIGRSADGVIVGTPDGRILYANPAACDMFGATEDDLRRSGRDGISDPSHPTWRAMLDERERTGQMRGIVPMQRIDGKPLLVDVTSTIVDAGEGDRRTGWILRDVTEQVRMERDIAAVNEVVQALLAGAEPTTVLDLVARHARIIFDATDAAVVTSADPPDDVVLTAAVGSRMSTLLGRNFPPGTVARQVIDSGNPRLINDLSSASVSEEGRSLGLGPAMVVPIVSGMEIFGVLVVGGGITRRPYTPKDIAVAMDFAERAGLALAIGQARTENERHQSRRADQLEIALQSRVIIEQAKGVVSAQRLIAPDDAFKRIRAYARSHSQDIHQVAQAVVDRRIRL
jgi:PAS domain S-box-containing protein